MTTIERRGEHCIVAVSGDIDFETSSLFADELVRVATLATGSIVVDLRACRTLDSSALGALVRGSRAAGGRLRLVIGDAVSVRRLLDVTGLSAALPSYLDVDAALDAERLALA